jgi:hypothetical protein
MSVNQCLIIYFYRIGQVDEASQGKSGLRIEGNFARHKPCWRLVRLHIEFKRRPISAGPDPVPAKIALMCDVRDCDEGFRPPLKSKLQHQTVGQFGDLKVMI